MPLAHPPGGATFQPGIDRAELERWYALYRRRQARRLVDLLPRDAVRPLYRAAAARSAHPDPLERLVAYCADLLPLPPFDVWAEDLAEHPEAHLRDWDDTVDAPNAADPATLAVRQMLRGSEVWQVRLMGFAESGAWRAYLAFRGPTLNDEFHTACVFREATAGALGDRFQSFDDHVLEGFLRSCLP